jgi:hypothetical protein
MHLGHEVIGIRKLELQSKFSYGEISITFGFICKEIRGRAYAPQTCFFKVGCDMENEDFIYALILSLSYQIDVM